MGATTTNQVSFDPMTQELEMQEQTPAPETSRAPEAAPKPEESTTPAGPKARSPFLYWLFAVFSFLYFYRAWDEYRALGFPADVPFFLAVGFLLAVLAVRERRKIRESRAQLAQGDAHAAGQPSHKEK